MLHMYNKIISWVKGNLCNELTSFENNKLKVGNIKKAISQIMFTELKPILWKVKFFFEGTSR